MELYIDGCSYTAGHLYELQGYQWWQALNNCNTLNASSTAKSNDAMLLSFLQHYEDMDKDTHVIIYWSHSERYVVAEDEHANYISKNLNMKPYAEVYRSEIGCTARPNFSTAVGNACLKRTISYMLLVQELCEKKGIEYHFICTDHYDRVRRLPGPDITKQLNLKRIFNWPAPPLKEVDIPVEVRESHMFYILEWAVTNLTIQFARAHNCIDEDRKHLNLEGLGIFSKVIMDWIEDENKDIFHHINTLDHRAAVYFIDILASAKDVGIGVHWLERELNTFIDEVLASDIKKSVEFIYES